MYQNTRKTAPQKHPTKLGRVLMASGLAVAVFAVSHAHEVDEDRGPVTTRSFSISGFDAVDISGVYDVEITVGDDYSIRLEGPEREMEYARVERDGDTLELGQIDKPRGWRNQKGINAYITLPSLKALDVSGVAEVDVDGVVANVFDLDVTGVADVEISGSCTELNADITGVSDVNAKGLECESGDVDMSGVGELSVYTSSRIQADISGVGEVVVYGRPETVEKSVNKYTASLEIK